MVTSRASAAGPTRRLGHLREARRARNRARRRRLRRWKDEERRLFQLIKESKERAAVSDANAAKGGRGREPLGALPRSWPTTSSRRPSAR